MEFQPDMVFLDLGMPEMSGHEVAVAFRQLSVLQDVYSAPGIGWNDAVTRVRVMSSGLDLHLTKPAAVESSRDVLVRH